MRDAMDLLDNKLKKTAYSTETIHTMARPLLQEGKPLMEEAGKAAATTAALMLSMADIEVSHSQVVILAGSGGNGCNGLFAGTRLASMGAKVIALATGHCIQPKAVEEFTGAGGNIVPLSREASIPRFPSPQTASQEQDKLQQAIKLTQSCDLIIDAMTGIGQHGCLHAVPEKLAEEIKGHIENQTTDMLSADPWHQHRPLVEAIDVPSGVGVDDGTIPGAYIPADVTVCLGALKPCCLLPPAAYACGNIVLVDFKFDTSHAPVAVEAMDTHSCASLIRKAKISDNKYTRGVVGLVTGSEQYPGAAVLSSCAAANSGAGMVRYVGPERPSNAVLSALPEAVLGEGKVQAWVLGSGVSTAIASKQSDQQRTVISRILAAHGDFTKSGMDENQKHDSCRPMVIDAGALDTLPLRQLPSHVVLTPHTGELASLLASMGETVTASDISSKPLYWARRACDLTGATILLKGGITIVISPRNNGDPKIFTTGFGPAWLATAGSGDVLAGIEGALLASQSEMLASDPSQIGLVTASAAFLHGVAASLASHSRQRAWRLPLLMNTCSIGDFTHEAKQAWSYEYSVGRNSATPLGHPIHASELVNSLKDAQELLLALPYLHIERPSEQVRVDKQVRTEDTNNRPVSGSSRTETEQQNLPLEASSQEHTQAFLGIDPLWF